MRSLRLAGVVALGATAIVCVLLSCVDPLEGREVTVVETCTTSALSTAPDSPQSSLRAYVEATDALLKEATNVETDLRDACNALAEELGLSKGATASAACGPISAYIAEVRKREPPAPGAFAVTNWVDISFPPSCTPTPGALEACLEKCAGPCDTSKCEPAKRAGKCEGECLGSCSDTGDNVPCTGSCIGEGALDGGSCQGECVGRCAAAVWTGACTGSCPAGFTGFCAGVCTGKCDGVVIGAQQSDAGPDGGGDGGGPPLPCPPSCTPPPPGVDGNCPGKCEGVCSKGANGDCKAPCLTFAPNGPPIGEFAAGFCGAAGAPAAGCTGVCRSATGSGTTSVCNGTCVQLGKRQCNGVCRTTRAGGCNGTLTNAFCEGDRACGQNAECRNACEASALLASSCSAPRSAQIFAVSDARLYAALVKHQGALGKAANRLANVRSASGFIANRALGDFVNLGLSGDLVHACVTQGRANAQAANTIITAAVSANPVYAGKR